MRLQPTPEWMKILAKTPSCTSWYRLGEPGGQGVAGSNPVIPTSFTEFFRFPVGGLTGVSHATATPLARSNSLRHLTQLFEYPIIRPSLARQRTQPKNHVDPPAVVSALPRRSFCA